MRGLMKFHVIIFIFLSVTLFSACGSAANTDHSNHSNTTANLPALPAGPQNLTVVDTPQRIKDLIANRGEQDVATPKIEIEAPADGSTVESSTVRVLLKLSGDLKGYKPMLNPETKMGNHIHVILDNQPYEAYYNLDQEFELRNVSDGEHTLRVFASRPWHESYKNEGSFQMVKFTVKNGNANTNQPAATNSGQQMSDAARTPEGKAMQPSTAGPVNAEKPLLTYSRPKGEYKGTDAEVIMIDFWLANAELIEDGGEFRIRYSVNGGEAKFIDKWVPIWFTGWTAGKHSIKLELVDKEGKVVDNGGYNSTTREITTVK